VSAVTSARLAVASRTVPTARVVTFTLLAVTLLALVAPSPFPHGLAVAVFTAAPAVMVAGFAMVMVAGFAVVVVAGFAVPLTHVVMAAPTVMNRLFAAAVLTLTSAMMTRFAAVVAHLVVAAPAVVDRFAVAIMLAVAPAVMVSRFTVAPGFPSSTVVAVVRAASLAVMRSILTRSPTVAVATLAIIGPGAGREHAGQRSQHRSHLQWHGHSIVLLAEFMRRFALFSPFPIGVKTAACGPKNE